MKITDFTYLLEHPNKVVDPVQTKHLEDIIAEYPYFQAARALHLKGLKNLNSYKYNKALKTTAAYTTDREVLFDLITSRDFLQPVAEQPTQKEREAPMPGENSEEHYLIEPSEDLPLPQDEKDAENILDPLLFEQKEAEEKLELGTPLTFEKEEKHSFAQWLQLASKKPVVRSEAVGKRKKSPDDDQQQQETKSTKSITEKFSRIDRFIAQNPKIVPKEKSTQTFDISKSVKLDKNELMTETLARVYLEQKKYRKAIQAYKILSLKYPEKSSFFADRIKAVQKIKQENK
jgi:hypothetical protein